MLHTRSAPESNELRRRRVAEDLAKLKQFLSEAKAHSEVKARLATTGANRGAARDATLEAMAR